MEENNKLIAEFLEITRGYFPDEITTSNSDFEWMCVSANCTYFFEKDDFPNTSVYDYLKFHSDWNWLMPVVEKIESMKIKDYSITTNITDCKTYISVYHYGEGGKWSILISNLNEKDETFNKIQRTYQAVIEFINFYNKQKEE